MGVTVAAGRLGAAHHTQQDTCHRRGGPVAIAAPLASSLSPSAVTTRPLGHLIHMVAVVALSGKLLTARVPMIGITGMQRRSGVHARTLEYLVHRVAWPVDGHPDQIELILSHGPYSRSVVPVVARAEQI